MFIFFVLQAIQVEQAAEADKAREAYERDHPKMSRPNEPIPMPDSTSTNNKVVVGVNKTIQEGRVTNQFLLCFLQSRINRKQGFYNHINKVCVSYILRSPSSSGNSVQPPESIPVSLYTEKTRHC